MRNIVLLVSLICWGCGGSQSQPTSGPAKEPSAAGVQTPSEKPAEGPAQAAEPKEAVEPTMPVGPASVLIQAIVKGKPTEAKIKIVDQAGNVAAEGKAGEKLTVQSGKYQAIVQVTDVDALVDKPSKNIDLDLQAGAEDKEQVSFPWAKIRLNVRIDGKVDTKAQVKLIRDGTPVATVKSADKDYVQISPGRYQAEVSAKNTKATVDNIMFPEGATQDVPVDVQFNQATGAGSREGLILDDNKRARYLKVRGCDRSYAIDIQKQILHYIRCLVTCSLENYAILKLGLSWASSVVISMPSFLVIYLETMRNSACEMFDHLVNSKAIRKRRISQGYSLVVLRRHFGRAFSLLEARR